MTNTFTVTTSATKIADASSEQRKVKVKNGATAIVLSKDSALTAANGYPLAANAEDDFDLEGGEQLFALTASGTSTVETL